LFQWGGCERIKSTPYDYLLEERVVAGLNTHVVRGGLGGKRIRRVKPTSGGSWGTIAKHEK